MANYNPIDLFPVPLSPRKRKFSKPRVSAGRQKSHGVVTQWFDGRYFKASLQRMLTFCCVVGCANRHSKDPTHHFNRFPTKEDQRERWIAAVCQMNPDGTPWYPSTGDRICSVHFVEGKNNDPTHPAYIPTHYMSGKPNCSKSGDYSMDESMRRFARCQDKKRL